ncbi:pyruvate kinase alpha/beta domain-containing protein [Bacteroidota bacterium]
MQEQKIRYFKKPGRKNTDQVIKIVKERIEKNNISIIVAPTTTGVSALKLLNELDKDKLNIVVVGLHAGFREGDQIPLPKEMQREIEKKGAKVFIGSHALSGVGRSISNKFGGSTPVEIIAHTLRMFCGQGIKVAVEISVMAADAGLIPTNQNIIALGGSHGGYDTAIVLKPVHMNNIFDLEIREILAKPVSNSK